MFVPSFIPPSTVQNSRTIARWVAPTLKEITRRKAKQGRPEPINRSDFIEWNRNSELFAFSKRLHEDFNPQLLHQAFTLRSYIVQEEQKQQNVGIENPFTNLKDNSELIRDGGDLLASYVEKFIASQLPKLPAEGVRGVRDFLLSDKRLAEVSRHIGTKDLILSAVSVPMVEERESNREFNFLFPIGIPTERIGSSRHIQSRRWSA